MKKRIAILGATGSIGDSALSVIAKHPDRYQVVGLSGFSRLEKLLKLCQTFLPKYVCIPSDKVDRFQDLLHQANLTCEILSGSQGLDALASLDDVDMVVASIVGSAGLSSTLSAVKAGKTVLLANKEALVMAGELMIQEAVRSGAVLLPLDSEHNAIFQCLPTDVQQNRQAIHDPKKGIKQLWLTASGGAFLDKSYQDMQNASIAQAVKHPNWPMGQKISVDSSTMMNKGLELIEAGYLFGMSVDNIKVVIHPQSIIHSMVEYVDGSWLAQLGIPNMQTPIAHALAYPERIESGVAKLDLFSLSNLTFLPPDLQKFHCLTLAYQAMQAGSYACIALNASNEVSVAAFLANKIRLTDIADINEAVLNKINQQTIGSLDDILAMDQLARQLANGFVANFVKKN
ncbi:1-deoxy-D-xylulose 5-phosphate reductoisomerase [Moraxella macacae 0408225]|uniref:1-deoxy-D-xylulose 5-phosphate reductoisomerase n=1 Tax=Moraxella macacae 0408225 TaxID=1230338 RepID=L2F698_9GAMM|nr:1-deoxy-D-xylulose-5-phosphate reductoisomerase [Moraxella macacae]ELA08564.1 1-deoxy-D-xylulose 5-phosphate reductoisomerase [Moraxella macacae 0408225]